MNVDHYQFNEYIAAAARGVTREQEALATRGMRVGTFSELNLYTLREFYRGKDREYDLLKQVKTFRA